MSRRRFTEGSCYEDVAPPCLFWSQTHVVPPPCCFLCQLVSLYCWRLHNVCPPYPTHPTPFCKSTVLLYCFYFRFAPFLWLPITIKCKTETLSHVVFSSNVLLHIGISHNNMNLTGYLKKQVIRKESINYKHLFWSLATFILMMVKATHQNCG